MQRLHQCRRKVVHDGLFIFDGYRVRSGVERTSRASPLSNAVKLHQNAELYPAAISKSQELSYRLKQRRQAWLQVTQGAASVNGTSLAAGDGAAISKEELLQIESPNDSEILLFDLR